MTDGLPRLRPAAAGDVPRLAAMVAAHARSGDVLPRSAESIRAGLDDWWVVEAGGEVIACGSLWVYGPHLAEVRSLIVDAPARGQGWGRAIVEALVDAARRRGIRRVFTLTRAAGLFERTGFHPTDKAVFPEKIWKDCQQCPLHDACDEIALTRDVLTDADAAATDAVADEAIEAHAVPLAGRPIAGLALSPSPVARAARGGSIARPHRR